MLRTVVTLAAILALGCRTNDRTKSDRSSRTPPGHEAASDRGVRVYEDEAVFLELSKDLQAAEADQAAEWKTIHVERDFKEERRFHGSLAQLFVELPQDEKRSLLAWLDSNPLQEPEQGMVARLTLGDERAFEEVLSVLKSGDSERCANVVWYLSWFDWSEVPRLSREREVILLPLLDHPDSTVVSRLTMVLEKQGEAFWWEAVKRRMSDPKYPHKRLLLNLVGSSSSPEAAGLVRQALRARGRGEDPDQYLYALQHLVEEGKDPELRDRAEEALFAAVAEAPAESGSAYYFLFQRDPERALPLAERYLLETMKQGTLETEFPASYLVREWGRRRGRDRQDLLQSWVSHPQLGRYALEALTELQAGSGNDALVDQWLELSARTKNPYLYHQVAAVGGEKSKQAALRLLKESGASPEREVGLFWALNDITLEKACEISVRHGLLAKMPSPEALRDVLREDDPLESRFHRWISVLVREGRAVNFDAETGTFPNRHDELILKELRDGGGGLFLPTRAIEVWRKDGPRYDVAFEHGGKWYRFGAEDLGDWYDVDAVMDAANRALADAGVQERFHSVVTGGQDALLLMAPPDGVERAAKELSLPMEGDAESARALGKAFEDEVIERLQSEGK